MIIVQNSYYSMTNKNQNDKRKPFDNMINRRKSRINQFKKLDTQIEQAQKQLCPEMKLFYGSKYRKKSILLKTTRNNSILK